MAEVLLSIGYDTEKPYGELARTAEGSAMRREQIRFDKRLIEELDSLGAPRTFFMLGDYLQVAAREYSHDELRAVYNPCNPLSDIQSHTYSHCVVRNISGRDDKKPLTVEDFEADLIMANKCLKDILGVDVSGLRMPLGYDSDFSDMPGILGVLRRQGFVYVSSNLREKGAIRSTVTTKRQPHTYEHVGFPDLAEIPSHGWADAIFTEDYCKRYGHRKIGSLGARDHYVSLISLAKDLSVKHEQDIYVSLCLHPWAVREFDSDFGVHRAIVSHLRNVGGKIITYSDVSNRIKRLLGSSTAASQNNEIPIQA